MQYSAILAGLVAVASLLAWLIAGRVLRPLRVITGAAQRITRQRLDERLALTGPSDELKELGDTFPAQGDPALLSQLVDNLIDNATKYNHPRGWIRVTTHAEHDEAVLEVSNSGPSLVGEELPGLLEPFRRASRQRVGNSNGLGLSIVRTIVEAHDGKLTLTALNGGGLTVKVVLPTSPQG